MAKNQKDLIEKLNGLSPRECARAVKKIIKIKMDKRGKK